MGAFLRVALLTAAALLLGAPGGSNSAPVYVVDVSKQSGSWDDASEKLRTLRHELEMYSEELLERPSLVVANKMDSSIFASGENNDTLAASLSKLLCDGGFDENKTGVVPLSAETGDGVGDLAVAMRGALGITGDGGT